MSDPATAADLVTAADELRRSLRPLRFEPPVTHVYNPLEYAWDAHRRYLAKAQPPTCEVLFLGMNPGPWGMAQTSVPFGEVATVREYLDISVPPVELGHAHPKRPIEGTQCTRSEVSGRRLWGLFRERFANADDFFHRHFVANYCPLVFMEATGRNRTPDKLPAAERAELDACCDRHLAESLTVLRPSFAVGVGVYAENCLKRVIEQRLDHAGELPRVLRILHPSPASPAANRGWAEAASKTLVDQGVW